MATACYPISNNFLFQNFNKWLLWCNAAACSSFLAAAEIIELIDSFTALLLFFESLTVDPLNDSASSAQLVFEAREIEMESNTRLVFKCYKCARKMRGNMAELKDHLVKIHGAFDDSIPGGDEELAKVSDKYLSLGKYLVKVTCDQAMMETEKKLRRCPFCECVVKKSHLLNHVVSIHDKVCPKCPTIKSLTHEDFVKHCQSRSHKGRVKFICSSCRFTTYLLSTFWEHRKKKHHLELLQQQSSSSKVGASDEAW